MPELNGEHGDMPMELARWLENGDPERYFRVNLKVLAAELQVPFQRLLTEFVRLTHEGKFNLAWEFHCTHCNGIPGFSHRFGELKSENYCAACDLGFRNTLDKNIEVTFTAHPSFRAIPPQVKESFQQQMLEAVKAKRFQMPAEYVSGLECLNNETFRELFGDDVLSTQESLAVETVTFLFTDIKGSTQMYSDLGDARSYEIVREHFKILFAAVERHGGIVVKTIGDAVMASFLRPADALQAASEAQHAFAGRSWEKAGYLSIKMGIHTGSAIVVNLNNAVDYFGNTVNLAARVQGSVEDHAIRFTRRVLEDPAVNAALRARRARLKHRVMTFKGISGEVDVYTLADF
jgi:class 3 adenylate cyclase